MKTTELDVKLFECFWGHGYDPRYKRVLDGEGFLNEAHGYSPQDIEEIGNLKVGDALVLDRDGTHIIYRLR